MALQKLVDAFMQAVSYVSWNEKGELHRKDVL